MLAYKITNIHIHIFACLFASLQHSYVRTFSITHSQHTHHPIHGAVACTVSGKMFLERADVLAAHTADTRTHIYTFIHRLLCVSFRNSWIKIDAQDENIFSSLRNIVHFTSIQENSIQSMRRKLSLVGENISCGLVIWFVCGILPLNLTLHRAI